MNLLATALLGFVVFLHPADAPKPPVLDDGNWEMVRDAVLPTEAESAWTAIPWRSTLWDAVLEGRAAKKPILLWAMNGHPLACT
jgi:hypothetical protein